jgi:drug/metabolite transporter (DMT)-like permease
MLAFLAVVWGASFLLIAIGLDAFTPGMVAWLRLIVAVLVLATLPATRRRVDRSDWPAITVVSIAGNAGPALLFAYAERSIESSLAGMLNAAVPLATASIAFMLGVRSLKRVHAFGLILGFGGVLMLSLPSSAGSGSGATGVLLVLLAVVGYALTGNVLVPLQQKYGALPVIYRAQALGVLFVAPFGLTNLGDNRFSIGPFVAVIVLGGVGTGIARSVQATIAGRMGAPRASIIGYLVPIVAMVLGVVFRDEVLEPLELGGLAVVLVSAFLVSRAVRATPN